MKHVYSCLGRHSWNSESAQTLWRHTRNTISKNVCVSFGFLFIYARVELVQIKWLVKHPVWNFIWVQNTTRWQYMTINPRTYLSNQLQPFDLFCYFVCVSVKLQCFLQIHSTSKTVYCTLMFKITSRRSISLEHDVI